jgi:hypothetical protein
MSIPWIEAIDVWYDVGLSDPYLGTRDALSEGENTGTSSNAEKDNATSPIIIGGK